MPGKMSEAELLQALREGSRARDAAIKAYFFDDPNLLDWFKIFVLKHNGTEEDAEELFHDAIIEFDRNVHKETFQERSSVQTYFRTILKNKWFMLFRKRNPTEPLSPEAAQIGEIHTVEDLQMKEEQLAMLDFGLQQLDKRQRDMLKAKYHENMSMKQIAETFDLSSEHLAKKYVDRFRNYLLNHIKKHPAYSRIVKNG